MFKKLFFGLSFTAVLAAVPFTAQADLAWTLGPDLPNPYSQTVPFQQMHGQAYVNGYVYSIGGNGAGGSGDLGKIYFAKVEEDGSLAEWQIATSELPPFAAGNPIWAYIGKKTFGYNGRIYIIGGNTNLTGGERQTVTIITPEVNGDVLETGIQSFPLSGITSSLESAAVVNPADGKLYYLGGGNTGDNKIYVAQINGTTGEVGDFELFGSLANDIAINFAPAVILNNKLYLIAGRQVSPAAAISTVQYVDLATAPVGTATLTYTAALPVSVMDHGASVLNNTIFVYGGCGTSGNTDTRKATFKAVINHETGEITEWVAQENIPVKNSSSTGTDVTGIRRIPNAANSGTAFYLTGGRISASNYSNATYIGRDNASVADYDLY